MEGILPEDPIFDKIESLDVEGFEIPVGIIKEAVAKAFDYVRKSRQKILEVGESLTGAVSTTDTKYIPRKKEISRRTLKAVINTLAIKKTLQFLAEDERLAPVLREKIRRYEQIAYQDEGYRGQIPPDLADIELILHNFVETYVEEVIDAGPEIFEEH